MKTQNQIIKMILSALFLALAFVMPFFTGQIPMFGNMLCPMHIPVLLCGFFCGWYWGLSVGLIAPLMRSFIMSMPPLFPTAICMAFELATYGFVAGLMHRLLPKKKPFVYLSLLSAMLAGRAVFGIVKLICVGINGNSYAFPVFIAEAFTEAIPGIIVQIILVPVLVIVLDNPKILNRNK